MKFEDLKASLGDLTPKFPKAEYTYIIHPFDKGAFDGINIDKNTIIESEFVNPGKVYAIESVKLERSHMIYPKDDMWVSPEINADITNELYKFGRQTLMDHITTDYFCYSGMPSLIFESPEYPTEIVPIVTEWDLDDFIQRWEYQKFVWKSIIMFPINFVKSVWRFMGNFE